jgi:hypothetical protein
MAKDGIVAATFSTTLSRICDSMLFLRLSCLLPPSLELLRSQDEQVERQVSRRHL